MAADGAISTKNIELVTRGGAREHLAAPQSIGRAGAETGGTALHGASGVDQSGPMVGGMDVKPEKAPKPTGAGAKNSPKSAAILKLLQRKRGATIAELQEVTGWQPHSVRGFLSGTVRKRMGLELKSEPGSDGVRRYTVAKA